MEVTIITDKGLTILPLSKDKPILVQKLKESVPNTSIYVYLKQGGVPRDAFDNSKVILDDGKVFLDIPDFMTLEIYPVIVAQ